MEFKFGKEENLPGLMAFKIPWSGMNTSERGTLAVVFDQLENIC